MSPFAKYIFRELKKSPIQPIIIILTLMCAILTMISSVEIIIGIRNELIENHNTWYDVEVKLSSGSDVRVLFFDDAEELVGDNGLVMGEFSISGLMDKEDGKDLINISATDIISADRFCGFKFTDYGRITEQNLNKSIIISSKAAVENNLHVGDKISISLLGEKFDFTVEAIALSEGILHDNIGVINIGAITATLAKVNPSIATLAGSIVPYTSLKIKLNNPSEIDDYKDRLSALPSLSHATVITGDEDYESDKFVNMTSFVIISITTIVILLLSAVVIASSFDILNRKRRADNALFMICGADPIHLGRKNALELLIYGIIAMILALPISRPISEKFNEIFGVSLTSIHVIAVFISMIGCIIIISFVILFEFSKSRGLRICDLLADATVTDEGSVSTKIPLVLFILVAIGVVGIAITPTRMQYVPAILSVTLFLGLIYLGLPILLKQISLLLTKALSKMKCAPAKLVLAFKNLYFSYPTMHASRLVSLLIVIIVSILICMNILTGQIDTIESLIDCDYVAIAADKNTEKFIEDIDGVDAAFCISITQELMTEEDTGLLGLSANDEAFNYLNPEIAPAINPKGGEIAISRGVAELCAKTMGDEINLTYESRIYSFKVVDIIDTNANLVFYDVEHLGLRNDLLCIRSTDTADGDVESAITNLVEARGASILPSTQMFMKLTKRLHSYAETTNIAVFISIITTLLGISNVLISSFISKKREREVYYSIGMTKTDITLASVTEILVCLLCAIILGILIIPMMMWMMDAAIAPWGVSLF